MSIWFAHDPCHDREHTPPAREDKWLIPYVHSGVLTIYSHDREPAPPARDLAAFFSTQIWGAHDLPSRS